MIATSLESTTLANVAYEATDQVLWLQFRSHAVYRYFGVPAEVYRALIGAPSKGTYFNRYIRQQFPYQRVATDARPPHCRLPFAESTLSPSNSALSSDISLQSRD